MWCNGFILLPTIRRIISMTNVCRLVCRLSVAACIQNYVPFIAFIACLSVAVCVYGMCIKATMPYAGNAKFTIHDYDRRWHRLMFWLYWLGGSCSCHIHTRTHTAMSFTLPRFKWLQEKVTDEHASLSVCVRLCILCINRAVRYCLDCLGFVVMITTLRECFSRCMHRLTIIHFIYSSVPLTWHHSCSVAMLNRVKS